MQLSIETYLDDTRARAQQAELVEKNEQISAGINENEARTKEAFKMTLGAMRASYMMVSGLSQVMGEGMGQAFSAIFGIATSAVATTSAIAAALAASGPAGWAQAGLMMSSLITAMVQLVAISTGQADLASTVGGINMTLHGIGSMIGAINF